MRIDVDGELIYPIMPLPYRHKPYTVHEHRDATEWEKECIEKANGCLEETFRLEGFTEFFLAHHCCVNEEMVKNFCRQHNIDSNHLTRRLFHDRCFPSLYGGWPGSIRLDSGFYSNEKWLFEKRMLPRCKILFDGTELYPLEKNGCGEYTIYELSCKPYIASDLCWSSKYNIPYLYSIRENFFLPEHTGVSVERDYSEVEHVAQNRTASLTHRCLSAPARPL